MSVFGFSPTKCNQLRQLISPRVGLFNQIKKIANLPGEMECNVCLAEYISSARTRTNSSNLERTGLRIEDIEYIGIGLCPHESEWRAIAEGLKRYSSCIFDESQLIWATANDLGQEAIDFNLLPRCSDSELADPDCPLLAPNPAAPIRWVRGISLLDGRLVWLPAIMVFLNIPYRSAGERFWFPTSTGCAAHQTVEEAVVEGICGVVEKDASAIVWLQKLALPRIDIDVVRVRGLSICLERLERAPEISQYFYDATTEFGIPTVYSVQTSTKNMGIRNVVDCSAAPAVEMAVAKTIMRATSRRLALDRLLRVQDDGGRTEHHKVGAMDLGRAEREYGFDFLLKSNKWRRLTEMENLVESRPRDTLKMMLDALRRQGVQAYAVDLTSDEAMRVGMRVVRVLIPELQPPAYNNSARFLGHPRLFQAPATLGYRVFQESDLHHLSQPFA